VSVFVLPHVDRLYLVTEAGRTRLAEVQRCIDLCQQAGRQLNGVIINKQDAPFWTRFLLARDLLLEGGGVSEPFAMNSRSGQRS